MNKLTSFARSPIVRIFAALVGATIILFSVRHAGVDAVQAALQRAAFLAPLVALLEAGIVTCDMIALRQLYGEEAKRIPIVSFVWAGLIGYPVMCLVPAGRAVAEAARAAVLARHTSAVHAAAAATRLQAMLLLANGLICVPCALAASTLGPSVVLPVAIGLNGCMTLCLGSFVLYAGSRSRVGEWLARLTSRLERFGPKFDAKLRGEPVLPLKALVATFCARLVQVVQCAVLVAAVGGTFGPIQGLSAEGVNLVAGTIGDLLPAQLGATEATFTWTSQILSLDPGDALSIALLTHMAQMFWVAVGLIVPLVWMPQRVAPASMASRTLDAGPRPK
jgi:hypothetical protein